MPRFPSEVHPQPILLYLYALLPLLPLAELSIYLFTINHLASLYVHDISGEEIKD